MVQNYKLETRKCACGCSATFRCLPESKQRYISKIHETEMMSTKDRLKAQNAYISRNPKPRGRPPKPKAA